MPLQVRRCNRTKKNWFLLILCLVVIVYIVLENTSHVNIHQRHFLQNRVEFDNIKEIFEIEQRKANTSVRYHVKDMKNIIPEVRKRRIISNTERYLFRRDRWRIIEKIKESTWRKWENRMCSGNIYNFDGVFILMSDVILDTSKKNSKSKGGEEIKSVIGRTEDDEHVFVKRGFFNLPCRNQPRIEFPKDSYFKSWFSGLSTDNYDQNNLTGEYSFTVLIKRGDYANLYWTLMELYNTYLTVRLFDENPKTANIILMDAHPACRLDDLWKIVFGNVFRIGQMEGKSLHKKLVWVTPEGPMSLRVNNIPFMNDFKNAIYQALLDLPLLYHECSNKSTAENITLLLRKDYLAHPRNPTGRVKRKIANEKELINVLIKRFPGVKLNAIQIDLLPIEEQIRLIYDTKILIGVHGAGLGHALLLRSGSTMIELFPSSYKLAPNPHFQMFAYWADVHYDRWYSSSPAYKNNEWFYVDPNATIKLLKHAINRTCTQ